MNKTRLIEIALELKALYQEKAQTDLQIWQLNQDAEARKLDLTPGDGWPGKNAEQRDAARDKAFADDDVLQSLRVDQVAGQKQTLEIAAKIQGLEAERRSLEWETRARMVDVLSTAGVQTEGKADAFDDVADHIVTQELYTTTELPF